MLIELSDDNMVRVTHHGLVDATQGYKINALYTATFRLSLFSVNQLDSVGSTATLGGGKCSISSPQPPITITGRRVNDLYFISPKCTYSINLGWTSKHTSDHSSKHAFEHRFMHTSKSIL
jgi:hypothetical protein